MQAFEDKLRSFLELVQSTEPALLLPLVAIVALSLAAWLRNWIKVSFALTLILLTWILAMPGGLPLYKQIQDQREDGAGRKELAACINSASRDLEVWTGRKLPAQVQACESPSSQA